jgi:cell division protease FtsH
MSLTTLDPKSNKPVIERRRFAWEDEETLVDRRKRLRYRLLRFFTFWRVVIFVAVMVALLDANIMSGVLAVIPYAFRLAFAGMYIVFQFVILFWWLSRPRMYTIWPGQEGVGFSDYRGQPELLEQARQIVKLLRGVKVFEQAGGEPLNGLLLEGPPGTGKTWLAKAISTEAGVPFFFIDASSLQSMFMGVSPLIVGRLYSKARRAAKDYGAAVIFMDEIDAVGSRGGVTGKRESYEEGVQPRSTRLPMMFGGMGGMGGSMILSTLLVEMDGFSQEHGWWARQRRWFYKTFLRREAPKPEKRVLTIGATNRIGALDPALLRPGRFDKKVRVDAPDMEGRREIFDYYLSKMSHDESMDPLILAAETHFYTPADIKYVLNEALRYGLFDGRTYMTYRDFRLAQPEHEMGLRSPIKNLTKESKRRLAAHEAGHAIAVRLYTPQYRISRITIIRQGGALGHVSYQPVSEEYDYITTYEQLMNGLRVSVAGKAAEMEFCGDESQTMGVGGDFASIRYRLQQMVSAGMFGALGVAGSERKEIDQMMEETFLMVLDEVRTALRVYRDMGEALIAVLIDKDEMLADEVEAFFDQYGLFTPKINIESYRKNEQPTLPEAN